MLKKHWLKLMVIWKKLKKSFVKKGIASAEKKMGRIAAEGRVDSFVDENGGAMIEVNCETDFVAKNDEFKTLTANMAHHVAELKSASVEEFLASTCPQCGKVIEDALKEKNCFYR